ncbi:MAG: YafY family protein [Spirochaetaceae bacterium]|nr:YafY family protein [Spirochaetaceae bacterium]
MKNERLLAIVDCLLLDGTKTAQQLAHRFEVTHRTVYRDIDSLCALGVPIVAEPGKGGGYSIEEGYRISRSFLTPDEVSDLSSILRAFAKATKDPRLERPLGKLAALGPRGSELSRNRSSGTRLLARRTAPAPSNALSIAPPAPPPLLPPALIADLSPWGSPLCDADTIRALRASIAERRLVAFDYVDATGRESRRVAEPFSLVVGGAIWYLHAFCRLRGAFRLFKIARMRGIETLAERFDPYARAPVPPPFVFDLSEERLEEVEVSVSAELRQSLEESFPGQGEAQGEGSDSGGRWTYRFQYPLGPYLIGVLLYYGPGLRVEKPASLRRDLAQAAWKIARANDFSEES